jgi:hypothetical protein
VLLYRIIQAAEFGKSIKTDNTAPVLTTKDIDEILKREVESDVISHTQSEAD